MQKYADYLIDIKEAIGLTCSTREINVR